MKKKYFLLIIVININCLFGQVSFQKHIISSNTQGAGCLYTSDIDGDGDLDILAAGLQESKIILFENQGGSPIVWVKRIIGSNVYGAHSVYAADFDTDGDLDVLGAAYDGRPGIALWLNNGGTPLNWTKTNVAATFDNAHEIYGHDVDSDGKIDVLGASSNLNEISWWKNNGDNPLTWTEQIVGTDVSLAKSVTSADIDGDNLEDILCAALGDDDIIWWKNDGNTPISWTKFYVDQNFGGAHKVQLVDMDNDGDLDILGAAYYGHQIAWWRNDGGDPLVWKKFIIKYGFSNACVAYAVDIDNDGDNDVIGSSQGKNLLSLWLNDGNDPIGWNEVAVDDNFNRVWPLYAADFDGDGDVDIVAASSHNGNNEVRWYQNLLITFIEDEPNSQPLEFQLEQNYPNPFNPSTTIEYNLASQSYVKIIVSNILGETVKVLADGFQYAGNHRYLFNAENLSSGIYYYQIIAGNYIATKKMVLIR
jgi:hypothetical protein